jgi:hypothetical protein
MLSPQPENILPSGADTVLTISGLGGFQYQARGLSQSLKVIKQTQQQFRTINGALRDLSNHAFRKYESEIACTDINAPPLDGLFPGMVVTVQCAAILSYKTGNSGSPWRNAVSGSEWSLGEYTFYRPELEMMVIDLDENFEEWKSDFQWKLKLEEV